MTPPFGNRLDDGPVVIGGIAEAIKSMKAAGRSRDDIVSALQTQLRMLQLEPTGVENKSSTSSKDTIIASPIDDPGMQDCFGTFRQMLDEKKAEAMPNVKLYPNDQGLVTSEYEDRPAPKVLSDFWGEWRLDDRKRNFVLIVMDMQNEYSEVVDHIVPNCRMLIDKFREKQLPIVWTNWDRDMDDGKCSAFDRFAGPRGVVGEHGRMNPMYHYEPNPCKTISLLAPITEDERSREIITSHISKFADMDCEGREIVYPMFEAWGVNTIILTGSWTDSCIIATAVQAVDSYGYDVVLVSDCVASATIHGEMIAHYLTRYCCIPYTTSEVCKHIDEHPELVEQPKAPLRGDVRFTVERQKR